MISARRRRRRPGRRCRARPAGRPSARPDATRRARRARPSEPRPAAAGGRARSIGSAGRAHRPVSPDVPPREQVSAPHRLRRELATRPVTIATQRVGIVESQSTLSLHGSPATQPRGAVRARRRTHDRLLRRRPRVPGRERVSRGGVPAGARLDQRPRSRRVPDRGRRGAERRRDADGRPLPPRLGGRHARRARAAARRLLRDAGRSSGRATTARPRACTPRTPTASSSRWSGSSPPTC